MNIFRNAGCRELEGNMILNCFKSILMMLNSKTEEHNLSRSFTMLENWPTCQEKRESQDCLNLPELDSIDPFMVDPMHISRMDIPRAVKTFFSTLRMQYYWVNDTEQKNYLQ